MKVDTDSLKRVMVERCLPENIKEKIWYKQTMEDVYYGGIWAMHSCDQAKHTLKMSEEMAAALEEMEQGGSLTAVHPKFNSDSNRKGQPRRGSVISCTVKKVCDFPVPHCKDKTPKF